VAGGHGSPEMRVSVCPLATKRRCADYRAAWVQLRKLTEPHRQLLSTNVCAHSVFAPQAHASCV